METAITCFPAPRKVPKGLSLLFAMLASGGMAVRAQNFVPAVIPDAAYPGTVNTPAPTNSSAHGMT
ncbi:MAG: hypothetical protein QM642_05760, partial [Edaphocola sp.]